MPMRHGSTCASPVATGESRCGSWTTGGAAPRYPPDPDSRASAIGGGGSAGRARAREQRRARDDRRGRGAVRIVIGEDSALFREGLARLLDDAGHEIVARAPEAASVVHAVRATEPAVAMIDIRLPPEHPADGARAARRLRE